MNPESSIQESGPESLETSSVTTLQTTSHSFNCDRTQFYLLCLYITFIILLVFLTLRPEVTFQRKETNHPLYSHSYSILLSYNDLFSCFILFPTPLFRVRRKKKRHMLYTCDVYLINICGLYSTEDKMVR